MTIIFDLDQTLVNSSAATVLRDTRKWPQVYQKIPEFSIYDGILDVLTYLQDHTIPYCIVTSSPSTYCLKVCAHWKINSTYTVCYHDTNRRKPHPDPIIKAISIMKADDPGKVISFGDRDIDIIASKAAGAISVGCLWGADDTEGLVHSKPDFLIHSPAEIVPLIKKIQETNS